MRFEVLGLHSLWLLMAPTRKPLQGVKKATGGEDEGVSASGFKLEWKLFYNFLIVYCRYVYFIFLQQ